MLLVLLRPCVNLLTFFREAKIEAIAINRKKVFKARVSAFQVGRDCKWVALVN